MTSYPSGYLASYVTELTGCGGPFTPWLIEATSGQTIQLTLFNFSLVPPSSSTRVMSSSSCTAFVVVTEPAVVTRNVTVCGGADKTGRQRHVYSSVTNRLLVAVWLQQQIADDAPYFMLKYEGRSVAANTNPCLCLVVPAMAQIFPPSLRNVVADVMIRRCVL